MPSKINEFFVYIFFYDMSSISSQQIRGKFMAHPGRTKCTIYISPHTKYTLSMSKQNHTMHIEHFHYNICVLFFCLSHYHKKCINVLGTLAHTHTCRLCVKIKKELVKIQINDDRWYIILQLGHFLRAHTHIDTQIDAHA